MRNRMYRLMIILMTFPVIFACGKKGDSPIDPPVDPPVDNNRPKNLEEYNQTSDGLKDYFKQDAYFDIGVAIEPESTENSEHVNLIKRHFNSITAENAMKWSRIQPVEGSFQWDNADKIVNFATSNSMKIRGHTLCWHKQVPGWIFEEDGKIATKEKVLERLKSHIAAVVGRYKGKVYAWDVVNEAIDDGGGYRNTSWYSICGEDYIIEAFKAAREADPEALLFYNDYNATAPLKRNKIKELAENLKQQGLIDGIGLQGHWDLDNPFVSRITEALDAYSSLGLELQITELDVTTGSAPAYSNELEQRQRSAYGRYFEKFRVYKDKITSVTFWGLNDELSWKNEPDEPDFPLLFDKDNKPKGPYFTVIDFE